MRPIIFTNISLLCIVCWILSAITFIINRNFHDVYAHRKYITLLYTTVRCTQLPRPPIELIVHKLHKTQLTQHNWRQLHGWSLWTRPICGCSPCNLNPNHNVNLWPVKLKIGTLLSPAMRMITTILGFPRILFSS